MPNRAECKEIKVDEDACAVEKDEQNSSAVHEPDRGRGIGSQVLLLKPSIYDSEAQ